MATYEVTIIETLERRVDVEAQSGDEAVDKAQEMYRAEEIVLDADDYTDTEISLSDDN
jgi:hypothetical protein